MPLRTKIERTSSQISNEARPSAFGEIWKRRVKWGHSMCPNTLHATIYPASPRNFGRFSFEARYTVTRITLFSQGFLGGGISFTPACQRSKSQPPTRRQQSEQANNIKTAEKVSSPPRRRFCDYIMGFGRERRGSPRDFIRILLIPRIPH